MNIFKYMLSSNLSEIGEAIENTIKYLKCNAGIRLNCDSEFELRVILNELLINAIIHGNKNDSNKNVRLECEIKEKNLVISIEDEGPGFDYKNLLDCIHKNRYSEKALYSECGRGILIVSKLSDKVQFNNIGNKVTISKFLNNM